MLIYIVAAWVVVIPLIVVIGGATVRRRAQADESATVEDQPMPARELRDISASAETAPEGPTPTA